MHANNPPLLPTLQAAVFDLDGTLIDYEGPSHDALQAPLTPLGKEIDWDLHAKIVGTRDTDWAQVILKHLDIAADQLSPGEYVDKYHAAMEEFHASIAPIPGALQVIESFVELGCPVAIATSSARESFDKKMKFHPDILKHVSVVVTGNEADNGKPAPDIFLLACERLGADPTKCIVFEDSPHGVEGGNRAGCATVALPDPRMPSNKHRFVEASLVLETFVGLDVPSLFGELELISGEGTEASSM